MKSEALAAAYYKQIGEKNAEGFKKYLHPDVEFYSPLGNVQGKEGVGDVTTHFMNAIDSLKIRATFGADETAMVVYNVDIPGIAKEFPGASMLHFLDGLIVRIELFYDSRPVVEKKDEIFS